METFIENFDFIQNTHLIFDQVLNSQFLIDFFFEGSLFEILLFSVELSLLLFLVTAMFLVIPFFLKFLIWDWWAGTLHRSF